MTKVNRVTAVTNIDAKRCECVDVYRPIYNFEFRQHLPRELQHLIHLGSFWPYLLQVVSQARVPGLTPRKEKKMQLQFLIKFRFIQFHLDFLWSRDAFYIYGCVRLNYLEKVWIQRFTFFSFFQKQKKCESANCIFISYYSQRKIQLQRIKKNIKQGSIEKSYM